jgi:hypothetical protein
VEIVVPFICESVPPVTETFGTPPPDTTLPKSVLSLFIRISGADVVAEIGPVKLLLGSFSTTSLPPELRLATPPPLTAITALAA